MSEIARYGKCTAHEGRGDELARHLLDAAAELESDPGCEAYLVNRQVDSPDTIWVTELWRSQADLDASLERIPADAMAAVKELVADWEMVELEQLGGKRPGPSARDGQGPPPPYTLRNIADVEDSAKSFGLAGISEGRFANDDLETEATGVSHHRLLPGKRQPFAHRHERAEEVYLVLSGSGRVKLGDEIEPLRPLDAVRVAPGVIRAFEAGEDGLELIAFGPLHKGDGELLQGWWAD